MKGIMSMKRVKRILDKIRPVAAALVFAVAGVGSYLSSLAFFYPYAPAYVTWGGAAFFLLAGATAGHCLATSTPSSAEEVAAIVSNLAEPE